MTCDGCAKSVTNAIKSSILEAAAQVNLEAKQVTVEGINDDHAMEQATARAGFEYAGPV